MPDAEMSLEYQEYKQDVINMSIANMKHTLSLMLDEMH